jgi:hypothetical protein
VFSFSFFCVLFQFFFCKYSVPFFTPSLKPISVQDVQNGAVGSEGRSFEARVV